MLPWSRSSSMPMRSPCSSRLPPLPAVGSRGSGARWPCSRSSGRPHPPRPPLPPRPSPAGSRRTSCRALHHRELREVTTRPHHHLARRGPPAAAPRLLVATAPFSDSVIAACARPNASGSRSTPTSCIRPSQLSRPRRGTQPRSCSLHPATHRRAASSGMRQHLRRPTDLVGEAGARELEADEVRRGGEHRGDVD